MSTITITSENRAILINHIQECEKTISFALCHIAEMKKMIELENILLDAKESKEVVPLTKEINKKKSSITSPAEKNEPLYAKMTRAQLEVELFKFNIKTIDVPKVGKTAKNSELIEAIKNAKLGILPEIKPAKVAPKKITTTKVNATTKNTTKKTAKNTKDKKEVSVKNKREAIIKKDKKLKSTKNNKSKKEDLQQSDLKDEGQIKIDITSENKKPPVITEEITNELISKKSKKPVIISENTSEEDESILSSDLSSSGSSDDETTSDTDDESEDEESDSESS